MSGSDAPAEVFKGLIKSASPEELAIVILVERGPDFAADLSNKLAIAVMLEDIGEAE